MHLRSVALATLATFGLAACLDTNVQEVGAPMPCMRSLALATLTTFGLGACEEEDISFSADTTTPPPLDIVDTAANTGHFDALVAAVRAADLEPILRGPGPFTVFAPTDAAFRALPAGTVEALLRRENKQRLRAVLTFHVAHGAFRGVDLPRHRALFTVHGQRLRITPVPAAGVRVGSAIVVRPDIEASNGVIHAVDTVLLPEENGPP